MRVIGLIGGIGSGKSVVRRILAELGAEVIDADRIGHEVYRPGTAGYRAVVDAFGPEVLDPEGAIDRRRLGARVFADPAELARLNAVVHPLIRAEIEGLLRAARQRRDVRAVVVEAAILLEAGWKSLVDEVWLVLADREAVLARLADARGLSREESAARIARQMSDDERRRQADVVIDNRGSLEDLREQVAALWGDRIGR